jgi:hypothetical protein
MLQKFKRFLFYVFVYDCKQSWYDFWMDVDLEGYVKFRKFAMRHSWFENSLPIDRQDPTTMVIILEEYFETRLKNDFDIKFNIWAY